MKSQFKNYRISENGQIIAHIDELKKYTRINLINTITQCVYEKKYYSKHIRIVKVFFVKDFLFFFYFHNKIWYNLDIIYIKDNQIHCENIIKTKMSNCNIFKCDEKIYLSSYNDYSISFIFFLSGNTLVPVGEVPGTISNIFSLTNYLYVNIIGGHIYELNIENKKAKLVNQSNANTQLIGLNTKYAIFKVALLEKEIVFVYCHSNNKLTNLSSKLKMRIKTLELIENVVFIVLECGCNDHLVLYDIESQMLKLIDNYGTTYSNVAFSDLNLYYLKSSYNTVLYCQYNLLSQKISIINQLYRESTLNMNIEQIALSGRTIEVLHYSKNKPNKGTIIYLHGGPYIHFKNEYNPLCLSLSKTGFDVVCVNYRGSSGYGEAFETQIDGNWGMLEIQDVIDISEYYQKSAQKLFLLGESYGAFLCLHSIAKKPQLWEKCCMFSPFVSPTSMYDNKANSNKAMFKKQLSSPIKSCDNDGLSSIGCKLLIVHGKLDDIIPISESDLVEKTLISCNKIEGKDYIYIKGNFGHSLIYPSDFKKYKKILTSFFID